MQFYKELRTRIYNELQINKKMAVTKQMVGHSRVDNSKLQLEHMLPANRDSVLFTSEFPEPSMVPGT